MSKHTENLEQTGTACVNQSEITQPWYSNIKYAVVGILFGIVFVKAEIVSWFRIQEMFRLDSFHMYGVIGTCLLYTSPSPRDRQKSRMPSSA